MSGNPTWGLNAKYHGEREDLGHWDKMYSIHSSKPLLLNVEVIVFSRLKMIALR
jgi:hypothetical protein